MDPESKFDSQKSSDQNTAEQPTVRKETAREVYTRLALSNPKFKIVNESGTGFVIGAQNFHTTK